MELIYYDKRFNPLAGVSCNIIDADLEMAYGFQSPCGCELQLKVKAHTEEVGQFQSPCGCELQQGRSRTGL